MKKIVFILTLLLVMASSLVAGTLAMYTTTIDNFAQGSVVAKEFVFVGEGTDSFAQGVKIAPTERVVWQFCVKNYENQVITETDLYYKLTFNVTASAGKSAIAPLTVTVKDAQGNVLNSITGTGTFDVTGSFPLSENGQQQDYTVELYWPSDDSVDYDYAGEDYGTTVNIDAVASQLPFDGSDPQDPPQTSDISVLYRTTNAWRNGGSDISQFNYQITITNHSDQVIEDWYIEFTLPEDKLTKAWSNAKLVGGQADDIYKFVSPNYNNPTTDTIQPGESVTFGGPAIGLGTNAPQNVSVGGSNIAASGAELTCGFGTLS